MVTQNKLLNIFSESINPFLTFLLNDISEKFNIPLDKLHKEYLSKIKVKKRRNTNKKGKMTSYSIFLKDENIMNQIKERYPDKNFGEYSKIKGEIWKTMSSKDKEVYKLKAKEFNQNLQKNKIETI